MYNCSNSEADYFYMKHVFYLAINQYLSYCFYLRSETSSQTNGKLKNNAILVVAKISTCDKRYKFTLQMAFELQQ